MKKARRSAVLKFRKWDVERYRGGHVKGIVANLGWYLRMARNILTQFCILTALSSISFIHITKSDEKVRS